MSNKRWAKKHREELESKYKNKLYDLKVNKRHSLQQCKDLLGLDVHLSTLKIWCVRWDIPIESTYPTGKNHWRSIKQNITKEILNKYYIEQRKTAEECGLILEISCSQIYRFLNKYNIAIRERSDYTGENSPLWKGGPGRFPYPKGFSRPLKKYIRIKDGFECQRCGKTQLENNQKLCIHHINYIKEDINEDNLTSLCRSCNAIVNFDRNRWQRHFEFLRFFKDIFSRIPEVA